MSTTTTATVITFDAKALGVALANVKNRAVVARNIAVAKRDGLTAQDIADAATPHYARSLQDADSKLSASKFSDTATKNIVRAFDIVDGIGFAANDAILARCLQVIEMGRKVANDYIVSELAALEEPTVGSVMRVLIQGHQLAKDDRKASKVKPDTEPTEDGEDGQSADTSRSLVDVILANLASLDYAGITADEAGRLMDAFEVGMARAANVK